MKLSSPPLPVRARISEWLPICCVALAIAVVFGALLTLMCRDVLPLAVHNLVQETR